MAISVNDNIKVESNKPLEFKFGPFTSISEANTLIPIAQRVHGLVFGIYTNPGDISNSDIEYYYYYNDLTDTSYKRLSINIDFTASTVPVTFDILRKYGFTTALTGNFTVSVTGAFESSMAKVRHNDSVEPVITSSIAVTKDGGTYEVGQDNYILFVCDKDDSGTVIRIGYTII